MHTLGPTSGLANVIILLVALLILFFISVFAFVSFEGNRQKLRQRIRFAAQEDEEDGHVLQAELEKPPLNEGDEHVLKAELQKSPLKQRLLMIPPRLTTGAARGTGFEYKFPSFGRGPWRKQKTE
jgi:hypothetical protein